MDGFFVELTLGVYCTKVGNLHEFVLLTFIT
jgi:hypothetical protein